MNIEKVYYNGKCIMTVDMDYIDRDSVNYEYLQEILGGFQERAFEEFDLENKYIKTEITKIWAGYENIYELKNKVEQEAEKVFEDDCFKKVDRLFDIMKEKLNTEEFEIFKKLRDEEVKAFNNYEQNFYAGTGSLDYVWVEKMVKRITDFNCL